MIIIFQIQSALAVHEAVGEVSGIGRAVVERDIVESGQQFCDFF